LLSDGLRVISLVMIKALPRPVEASPLEAARFIHFWR